MNRHFSLPMLLTALVAAPLAADVTIFETLVAGEGDVRILDETGVLPERRPVELQGITLLGLDYVGRAKVTEELTGGARWFDLPNGAARVELPARQGNLYHFRRGSGAATVFGWFVVGPDGAARHLLEMSGQGGGFALDPFSDRVGLAADGQGALIATTLAAGGNAYEVDLVTGSVTERTSERGPFSITRNGLALSNTFGVIQTPLGPWRFDRLPAAQVERVPFAHEAVAGLPATRTDTRFFGPDLVCSQDGSTLAVTAGADVMTQHLYVFGSEGKARRITDSPACISSGGFLPEVLVGPTLALSPDGSNVAWRVENGVIRDIHMRSTEIARSSLPTFAATADVNFTDTLNDSGVIAFFNPTDMMMVVGETDVTGTIDRGDVYMVRDVGTPTPEIINVTGTSGDLQLPFLEAGRFGTEDGLTHLPDGSGAIALVRLESGDKHVYHLDWATGTRTQLVSFVDHVELYASTQGQVVFSLLRDNNNHELYHLAPGATSATQLMSFVGMGYTRWATSNGGFFAGILTSGVNEFLGRVHLPSLNADDLTGMPLQFGPTLRFVNDVELAITIKMLGVDYHLVWTAAGTGRLLPTGPTQGFILP